MILDDTQALVNQPKLSQRESELEICRLLESACQQLQATNHPLCREQLTAFLDQLKAGDASLLDELAALVESCAVYDTPEDGYDWSENQLPVQLASGVDSDFIVSYWAQDLARTNHTPQVSLPPA